MNKNKPVYYEQQPEVFGEPSLKLDGDDNQDIQQFAMLISEHTGIPKDRIESMICKYGIEEVLKNPSLICTTKDQEQKLKRIGKLITG